jgi:hypothetical protein
LIDPRAQFLNVGTLIVCDLARETLRVIREALQLLRSIHHEPHSYDRVLRHGVVTWAQPSVGEHAQVGARNLT